MGFTKHTWEFTHSQVNCHIPFVSGVYESNVIRQKQKDNAKHHQIARATQYKAVLSTVPQVLSHPALPMVIL